MGIVKDDLENVAKKARNVLSGMSMGSSGRPFPSNAASTAIMTVTEFVRNLTTSH